MQTGFNCLLVRPTLEQHLQRLIDAFGYHDAEQIPTKDVLQMFEVFFKWEHRWNESLEKIFEEHLAFCTSLPPFVPLPNRESK